MTVFGCKNGSGRISFHAYLPAAHLVASEYALSKNELSEKAMNIPTDQ